MMQNGVGAEEDAARVLGPNHPILAGLCFLCSHKVGPGHIRHLDYGMVTLASWSPTGVPIGPTPIAEQIAADLASAGVEVSVSPDLVLSRWKKLVWNVPFSGLCVVLHTDTQQLVTDSATRQVARELMQEVQTGARALGRPIPDDFLDYMFELTDRMTPYAPSMQLDYEAGRPMEIEAIYERPVAVARKHGAEMPRVDCLARLLRFMERHRAH
jgi:2-dehydropantoate 2-reductase